MVEYIVILGAMILGVAVAVAAVGPELINRYQHERDVLYSPFP